MKYQDHMEDPPSSSHKEEKEEENAPYYREDTKKAIENNGLTLLCHHVVHVISVMSCRVMSHHVPHHFVEQVIQYRKNVL